VAEKHVKKLGCRATHIIVIDVLDVSGWPHAFLIFCVYIHYLWAR